MSFLKTIFPPARPDRYAAKVIRAIQQAGVNEPITYDAKEFRLTIAGPAHGVLNLHNLYREYCSASPFKRGELVRRWGRIALQTRREDDSPDKENLLPRVRDRLYHELLRLQTNGYDIPTRPITEDLVVEVVCDHSAAIQTLGAKTLSGWQMTFDEALKIGRDNLWRRSGEDFVVVRDGLYKSPWQDNHDASRLFLHDLIWQLPVRGKHVAVVPNRDLLLVTGSDDFEGLAAMAQLARGVLELPRPMTGQPVVLEGSTWKTFDPPPDPPAYRPLRELIETQRVMAYSEQRAALTAEHEAGGDDIFVPQYTVMQRKESGDLWSWTSWVQDVTHALMPRADRVMFGGVDAGGNAVKYGFGDWERVRAVAGELMEETDLYPPRYRVRAFPSPEQLKLMELDNRTD